MARSDMLKADHQKLLGLVTKMTPLLSSPDTVKTKAADIRTTLSQLAGAVTMHLSMEDNTMYKQMLAHPTGKTVAERFQREMGGIKTAFTAYVGKYNTPAAIAANPAGFISETQGIIKALGDRIRKEEGELYPAFDKI